MSCGLTEDPEHPPKILKGSTLPVINRYHNATVI